MSILFWQLFCRFVTFQNQKVKETPRVVGHEVIGGSNKEVWSKQEGEVAWTRQLAMNMKRGLGGEGKGLGRKGKQWAETQETVVESFPRF